MKEKNRVLVTGVGVVAPNGVGKEAFWQALMQGLSGVRPIRRFDSHLTATRIAGELEGFDPLEYFAPQDIKKVDRSNIYAMAAGLMAVKDAGLNLDQENLERFGSSIGNAACGVEYAQQESEIIHTKGPRWGSPYLALAFFSCGSNGLLSIRLGTKGPVLTFCNGNTSGSDAIGMAYRMVQNGKADIMIAGGTEAPLIPLFVGSLTRDGWLSQNNEDPSKASRPFDRGADGMVLSEGAGIVVLESLAHAQARKAHCYAEISGYSSVSSAFSMLEPEPNGLGLVRTMKEALKEAHLTASDVDFINAQGFSLPDFDRMESRCIREVFSNTENGPWVSAISSHIGNTMGASGGIQGVVSALALDQQTLPPHAVVNRPDHQEPLRLAPNHAQSADLRAIVQNSYCFMGKHSSLIFKKFNGDIE